MQDYIKKAVRSSAILTTSYVAGTTLEECHLYNQLIVLIQFTIGSLTTAEVKIEFSPDNTTFFQETFTLQDYTNALQTEKNFSHQYAATGNYTIELPLKYRFVKISAKGTGTTTNSLMVVDAILGVV